MTSGDVQQSSRFVYLQVAPLTLVLLFFFAIPVALVIAGQLFPLPDARWHRAAIHLEELCRPAEQPDHLGALSVNGQIYS